MKLFTANLDGKKIAYHQDTHFVVQVGKGNSSYKTKYECKGSLTHAVFYFNNLKIANGYKKRLLMPSSKDPILARFISK